MMVVLASSSDGVGNGIRWRRLGIEGGGGGKSGSVRDGGGVCEGGSSGTVAASA